MSEENVEIVRGVYDRWSEGDFQAAVKLFDPQIVLVVRPVFGIADGVYLGPKAIGEYTLNELLMPMRKLTMEAEEISAVGDHVVVDVHQHGIGKASGVPTETRFCSVWSFRGQKVIRIESFATRAEALEAAGLSE
jgi:ketosteroid isomerase-like protein